MAATLVERPQSLRSPPPPSDRSALSSALDSALGSALDSTLGSTLDYPKQDETPSRDFATINALGFLLMLSEQPGLRGPWNWTEMEVESNDSLIYGNPHDCNSDYEKDISMKEMKALRLFEPEMEEFFMDKMLAEFRDNLRQDPGFDPQDFMLEYRVNSEKGEISTKLLQMEICHHDECVEEEHVHVFKHTLKDEQIVETENSIFIFSSDPTGYADVGELGGDNGSESELELDILAILYQNEGKIDFHGVSYTVNGMRKLMTGRMQRHEKDPQLLKFEIQVEFHDDVGIWHEYVHSMVMFEAQAKEIVENSKRSTAHTTPSGSNDEQDSYESSSSTSEEEDSASASPDKPREEFDVSYEVEDQNRRQKRHVKIEREAMVSDSTERADAEVAKIFDKAEQSQFRPVPSENTETFENSEKVSEQQREQLNDEFAEEIAGDAVQEAEVLLSEITLEEKAEDDPVLCIRQDGVTEIEVGEGTTLV